MAEPSDMNLYNEAKREVDKSYDKPSAYRSMAYTRTYLKKYREKYGDDKKAYKGKNPEELKTWRKEKWIDVKSVLKDPKKPTACGNAPIKAGEYPLCMPIKEIQKYSKSELGLLVQRKNQIGKKRLVKDAFLRDILKPDEIPPIREYKEKYVKDKRLKLPKPLPKAEAEKILKEKPIQVSEPKAQREPKPPRDVLKGYPETVIEEVKQKFNLNTKDDTQEIRNKARKLIRAEKARQTYIPKERVRNTVVTRIPVPEGVPESQRDSYQEEEYKRIKRERARAAYVPRQRPSEPYMKKDKVPVEKKTRQKKEKQNLAMLPDLPPGGVQVSAEDFFF